MSEKLSIEDRIKSNHRNDNEQLKIIFEEEKSLLIEAPAGYGKTKTMISKLAYILAKGKLPYPKKILALTFSVNAALNIKRGVSNVLKELLKDELKSIGRLNSKFFISNYHGFCRNILSKYGYLIDKKLSCINSLDSVDDSKNKKIEEYGITLETEKVKIIECFNTAIKNVDDGFIEENMKKYNDLVIEYFLPNNIIPFNAILTLTLKLFDEFPEILKFYQAYFYYIIVDEFQDTNILSWFLLKKLINDDHKLILMGDPLQRIYGFIGAVPDLLEKSQKEFILKKVKLKNNYRYKENEKLLLLDTNLRKNAENPISPQIKDDVQLVIYSAINQEEEALWVYNKIEELIKEDKESKIAVLVRQGKNNKNTAKILQTFRNNNLDYFDALFSEEDKEYREFHSICLKKFNKLPKEKNGRVNKKILESLVKELGDIKTCNNIYGSLYSLLDSFIKGIFSSEFSFLNMQEKIEFIREVLENNSLKQQMEYLDKKVVFTTVHGAKGLEWDYVILPDIEKASFPHWNSICKTCHNRHFYFKDNNKCKINWKKIPKNDDFEKKFLEELSVFYVAVTRAKKEVFFSFSKKRINNWEDCQDSYMSCFVNLKKITTIEI